METRFKILIIVLIFSSNLFGQTPTYGERKWIKTTLTDTAIINGGDVTLKKLTAKNATFADTVKADSIKVGNTWISTTTFLTKQNLIDTTTYDGTKNEIAIERNARNDSILALRNLANTKVNLPDSNIIYTTPHYVDSLVNSNVEQTYIYAGTSPDGYILRSSDNGLTWSNLGSAGKGQPLAFCQLSNGDLLYTTDEGYVVNHSKGTSVEVSDYPVRAISQHLSASIYVGDDNGDTYYSDDNAVSFTQDPVDPIGRINYISSSWLYFSVNGIYDGSTGLLFQSGHFTSALQIPNTDTIYAGSSIGHIWRSINAGTSWADLGDKTGSGYSILSLAKGNGSRILFTYDISPDILYTDDGFTTIGGGEWTILGVPKCLTTINNYAFAGDKNGTIGYSNDNGDTGFDTNALYSQDSINCILAVIGSTYVQPGDLTIYETKVQHAADTTLQRAWKNGLEARKVNKGDTISRTAGSYITPTQVANTYLAKVDANHLMNENDTLESNYKLLTRTQNYYNVSDTVNTDMTNVYLVTFSKAYREHRIDTLSGNATVTITKSALAKPGAIEVFYSRGTGATKTINFGSCKNSCIYEYDDTADRMNVITFKLCTGGIIERCVYQRY
jgi:hypothetical protein